MPIYDEIKKKFILPNAYDDWKDYRKTLTDYIIRLGETDNAKTVSVIGAGRCNDISLHRLCGAFETVTLLDYDAAALSEAIKGLTNPEIRKIHIAEQSVTGIKEIDISAFCEKTLADLRAAGSRLSAEVFSGIVFTGLERLKSKMFSSESELSSIVPEGDIILCSGVFSQLFSTVSFFIRSCAGSLPAAIVHQAMKIADRADELLKSFGRTLIPLITGAIVRNANVYAVFCNEYSENHPVEGACQCIETVRNTEKVLEEAKLIWDFNRSGNIRYEMLIQLVKGKGFM